MSTTKEIVYQGWLTKSPPTKAIFRPRWRRRWFILKSGSFPNQFVLEYFTDDSCRRLKGQINLDECEQIVGPLSVQDRHNRHTFHLRTPARTYYLAADSENEMSKWVEGLCQVCGLKTAEDDDGNVVYTKPSNENAPVVEERTPESHNLNHKTVQESSPTPSNKSPSGPYIPISECFTGKPIIFNPTTNEEVTYYNTSSFPFPPKVNWATHPCKDEPGSDCKVSPGQRSNEHNYVPPRPPKKSSSKPTTPTTITSQPKSSSSPRSLDPAHSPTGNSAGVYENVDENPADNCSTSSSLHSPLGSAGGLYCNIPDTTENKTTVLQVSKNSASPKPSSTVAALGTSAMPPKVDRNLKPEVVKKTHEVNAASKSNNTVPSQSRLGCMTLPNNFYGGGYYPGPEIDRTRKPSDGHLTLACTPAQLKHQSTLQNSCRNPTTIKTNTNTLPSSSARRAGPVISPHDKKPIAHHEYESAQELSGTYMQIDCKTIKEFDTRTQSLKLPTNKKLGVTTSPPEGHSSVEYRLIDHVKTKALNQMRIEREKQLQPTLRH